MPSGQILAIKASGPARVTATKILRVTFLQMDGGSRGGTATTRSTRASPKHTASFPGWPSGRLRPAPPSTPGIDRFGDGLRDLLDPHRALTADGARTA